MFLRWKLFIFLVINNLQIIFGDDICIFQETCEKCLTAKYDCGWCIDENYGFETPRCMTRNELVQLNCTKEKIVENSAEMIEVENKETQDFSESENVIQLQPQKIKLKLVKSHVQQIKMTYRPAKNNPLDLYYLMDLTWSMKDDKQTLVNMGEQIANALHNLTKNYRLGYGSFADKPAMPMIMPNYRENPCSIEREVCEPTYGFRHHLPLTSNIKEFVKKVNESKVTGNLDNLEGGLDALMQILVCDELIGWNQRSRKIVILASDGLMHFAGDGILGGIVVRNDKKCHLSEEGEYLGSLDYDYPSLEEIYHELVKRKISVIFAVTHNVVDTYHEINQLMQDISGVETLSVDSSNILQLIENGYQRFIRKVQFLDNSPPFISVTYETDCAGLHPNLRNINFCDQVEIGKDFEFYINISLKDFPPDDVYDYTIRIEDSGISEYLEIDVNIQKPCPCMDNKISEEEKIYSKICNHKGYFHCGTCFCEEGWIGKWCMCDSQNATSLLALESNCRKSLGGSNYGSVCSNRGDCKCGVCDCYDGYEGKYCECDECFDCDDHIRYECNCGQCNCKPEWTGIDCLCPVSEESCRSPHNNQICSGQGVCECGVCECNSSYMGNFCEGSLTAGNQLCSYYEPCVQCLINENQDVNTCKDYTEICTNLDKFGFQYEFANVLSDYSIKCLIRMNINDKKCDHEFTYDTHVLGTYLKIQVNNCDPFNFAGVGGILFLATLLLLLAIVMIVKTVFYFQDKREFALFNKEIETKTSYNMESPIYKSPITMYTVPEIEETSI